MMSTFENTGVLDPKTWKNPQPPDGSRESWIKQWGVQKAVVKQCRRFGIDGYTKPDGSLKQPGRTTIAQFIADKFPDETPKTFGLGYRLAKVHVIGKWIRGIEFAPDEGDYSPDDVSRKWKSYVARLSMISEFWYSYPLTPKQAEIAQDVGNEFQDPLGKQVDLLPQLAVVRALTNAERDDFPGDLQSFALYFTCAPWESGRDFYERKIKGIESAIRLPDFTLPMHKGGGWRDVSPVYEDALRQLGVPYTGIWYDFRDGSRDIGTIDHYGDTSKGACDWKIILKNQGFGELLKTIRPVDMASARWLEQAKWKQVERIHDEDFND